MTTTSTAVRFFVAVPANGDDGIYGIGHTAKAALAEAYRGSQTHPADVSQDEEGEWIVSHNGSDETFQDEDEARDYAAQLGFVAEPCTERLYVHVERYGCDAEQPGFRWAKGTDGLTDLDLGDDEVALDDAVDEVRAGFEGLDDGAKDEWTASSALADAHDYVFAYVIEGDETGMWGDLAEVGTPFRTALDLLVRDEILDHIEAR
jgi:hypothetical protein